MDDVLLNVEGLCKSFGRETVLADVSFTVAAGEAVAFIGENGAGKSTLAKCLVGVHEPDAGEIGLDGAAARLPNPRAAKRLGIAFLPQELAYVPELGVAENVVLGQWPGRRGLTSARAMRRSAAASLEQLKISLDVDAKLKDLSVGERQLVEIAKALRGNMRLLVLDEPTAALNDDESQILFDVLGRLTAAGVGVVFVSHRMDEVHRFSTRVNVMRNGRLVATLDPRTASREELVTHMLGRPPEILGQTDAQRADRPVALELKDLALEGPPAISDFGFSLLRGEVLGLFGVRGCGADLVAAVLAGRTAPLAGTIAIGGRTRAAFATVRESMAAGVAYVPPERKKEGLVPLLSVAENITLPVVRDLAAGGIRVPAREARVARDIARRLDVRCEDIRQPIEQLSGGNQQKALLGSRILTRPEILVLHEPTRGVDVGARLEIHRLLRRLAADGLSCLVVSSDVEEVVTVSDRVLVLRDGAIAVELAGSRKTLPNAVHAAAHAGAELEMTA